MLSSADESLTVHDPALPGLGLLLDDAALAAWLGRRLGTDLDVSPRYLRYKHATSCVLAAEVRSGSGRWPCLFTAHAPDDSTKLAKTVDRAPPGSVLGVDFGRGLLATTPAADRDLPALALLEEPDARRRLLRGLVGDQHGLRRASVETLRYKPQRRWVGLVTFPRGMRVVLRVYPPATLPGVAAALTAWSGGPPAHPRVLGSSTERGVAALEWVAGTILTCGEEADFAAAGALLGRLHTRDDVVLAERVRWSETGAVHAAADHLGVLLPDQADEVSDLAQVVDARLRALSRCRRPVHGDFSADQVVVGADGQTTLIDLDASRPGDPAEDLACAAAALGRDVVLGRLSPAT
ncbi:MAG: aminoglycoside phosphotransferase family protein, partial [Actinomycetota bacterium]|nr:aminoglycoside phosphotransferase family protein [Actinomycetota bacterium]